MMVKYRNLGKTTEYEVSNLFENVFDMKNIWLGLGLNIEPDMENSSVVMCKITDGLLSVEHYWNDNFNPVYLDPNNIFIGLSSMSISLTDNTMICKFTRDNSNSNPRYWDQNTANLYIEVAYGNIQNKIPTQHIVVDETKNPVNFPVLNFSSSTKYLFTSTINIFTSSFTTSLNQNTTKMSTHVISVNQNYSSFSGTYSNGDFSLYWTNQEAATNLIFETKTSLSSNFYSAFAFSYNDKMGDDDVIVCSYQSATTANVQRNYNKGYSSSLLNPSFSSIGLSKINVSLQNGILRCEVTRDKYIPNEPKNFDLNNYQFYLLFARGSLLSGRVLIAQHNIALASPTFFNFSKNAEISTLPPRSKPPLTAFTSYGKFEAGNVLLEWTNSNYYIKFSFTKKMTSNSVRSLADSPDKYFAFGFSHDKKMGDDSVAICQVSKGEPGFGTYYNTGKVMPSIVSSNDPQLGLSETSMSYENGVFKCNFTREKSISGVSNYFDLSKKYFLLMAIGSSSSGIGYHGKNVLISNTKIDFTKNGSYTSNNDKLKAHACLMVFGWMFCVAVGILFARYYKDIFPSVELLGVAFWFNVHRLLMFLIPILSITSFLVALSDLNWEWVDKDKDIEYAHSIIGIITIAFSIVQVSIALIRPNPDHSIRPIFNIFHRFLGLTCLLLATTTIFIGVFIEKMNLDKKGWGIMIAWTTWLFIIPILLEVLWFFLERTSSFARTFSGSRLSLVQQYDPTLLIIKWVLLGIHVIIALGLTIALIAVIGSAKNIADVI